MAMRRYEQLDERINYSHLGFLSPSLVGEIGNKDTALTIDFDNDGDVDVLTPGQWFVNNGDSTEFETKPLPQRGFTLATIDANGDDEIDLLTASNGLSTGEISYFENRGGNELAFRANIRVDDRFAGASNMLAADLDGDGDDDFVANNTEVFGDIIGGYISWHENESGEFASAHVIIEDNHSSIGRLTLTDLDSDTDIDIVTPSGIWFENIDGKGEFLPKTWHNEIRSYSKIDIADIDLDGDVDVFAVDALNKQAIVWHENLDGHGTFSDARVIADKSNLINGVLDDFDNDGDVDAVVATYSLANQEARIVYYENKNGTLEEERQIDATGFVEFVAAADMDNDNNPDLLAIIREEGPNNKLVLFRNDFNRVVGDVNCDLEFNTADLALIFFAGEYEDGIPNNSTYDEGDFNGDGDFDSSDFVFALTNGQYKQSAIFSRADYFSTFLVDVTDVEETSRRREVVSSNIVDQLAQQW